MPDDTQDLHNEDHIEDHSDAGFDDFTCTNNDCPQRAAFEGITELVKTTAGRVKDTTARIGEAMEVVSDDLLKPSPPLLDSVRDYLPVLLSYLALGGYILGSAYVNAYYATILRGLAGPFAFQDVITHVFTQTLPLLLGVLPLVSALLISRLGLSAGARNALGTLRRLKRQLTQQDDTLQSEWTKASSTLKRCLDHLVSGDPPDHASPDPFGLLSEAVDDAHEAATETLRMCDRILYDLPLPPWQLRWPIRLLEGRQGSTLYLALGALVPWLFPVWLLIWAYVVDAPDSIWRFFSNVVVLAAVLASILFSFIVSDFYWAPLSRNDRAGRLGISLNIAFWLISSMTLLGLTDGLLAAHFPQQALQRVRCDLASGTTVTGYQVRVLSSPDVFILTGPSTSPTSTAVRISAANIRTVEASSSAK